jgi:hypothetical protein
VVQPNPCTGADGDHGAWGGSALVVDFDHPPPSSSLRTDEQLTPGQQLVSPNGQNILALQTDSNFCMYVNGRFAWCANTYLGNARNAIMQSDGNLCVYPVSGSALWCSGTAGHPGSYVTVQDNGQAVIYDGLTPIWTIP